MLAICSSMVSGTSRVPGLKGAMTLDISSGPMRMATGIAVRWLRPGDVDRSALAHDRASFHASNSGRRCLASGNRSSVDSPARDPFDGELLDLLLGDRGGGDLGDEGVGDDDGALGVADDDVAGLHEHAGARDRVVDAVGHVVAPVGGGVGALVVDGQVDGGDRRACRAGRRR